MRGSDRYWLGFAFTHLSELIRGDVPLHTAFRTVAEDLDRTRLKKTFNRIADRLENGESLTDISLFAQMVPSGTAALFTLARERDDLATGFDNLAGACMGYGGAESLPDKPLLGPVSALVVSLSFIFVMGASVGAATVTFGRIFQSLGASLPLLTRICLVLGQFLYQWWIVIFLVVFVTGLGSIYLSKSRNSTLFPAWIKWNLPILSRFDQMEYMVAVTQFLTMGIRMNLPLHLIFKQFSESCPNRIWQKVSLRLAAGLSEGVEFGDAAESAGFPNPDYHYYFQDVSDKNTLETLANAQEELVREMDMAYRILMHRFHILYFFGTGVIVGLFVIAMYLPMFKLIGILSG